MKRFHIHLGVKNLDESIRFYSTLFGAEPTKRKTDYAKWMLADPKLNFAISTRTKEGVDHLGIQAEEASELTELTERLKKADLKLFGEGETTCCYANSHKAWVQDPSGLAWETYQTMSDAEVFNRDLGEATACCAPAASAGEEKKGCC